MTDTAVSARRRLRRLSRRSVAIVLVLAVAGAVAGTWAMLRTGSPAPRGIVDKASSETAITEQTITSQRQVGGTLGFAVATTVVQPVGTGPDAVSQADEKMSAAALSLTQANADLSAAGATLSAEAQTVVTDQAQFAAATQKVSAGRTSVAQARAAVTSAQQSYTSAQSAAADAHSSA